MRVLIVTAGTLGDVVPYAGLGVRLRQAGHDVAIAAHESFGEVVRGAGLQLRAIPGDIRVLLASGAAEQLGREASGPRQLARTLRIARAFLAELGGGIATAAQEGTDVLLLSTSAAPLGWHVAEAMGIPSVGVYLQRLGELAVTTLRLAGLRGIVQAGAAGLSVPDHPDDVLAIGDVPHEWLFPRMAAVVHHGGAGTAAAALRAGVPSVAVPVRADQPFWAARTVALGTSPGVVPVKRLTAERLAAAVTAAVTDGRYRQRAAAVADRVAHEDGCAPVVATVDALLDRAAHG